MFVEKPEVDQRRLERVARAQGHGSCPVAGMRLEHDPGQRIEIFRKHRRIPWVVAGEVGEQGHTEKIRQRHVRSRSPEHGQNRAIRRVDTLAAGRPLRELRVVRSERGSLVDLPRIHLHAIDDADLVAVLKVPADAGQNDQRLDVHPS
jgi:hypothetical protein